MNTVELEAGKMQLVRAIASINDPEVLAAVREVMYEKMSSVTIHEGTVGRGFNRIGRRLQSRTI